MIPLPIAVGGGPTIDVGPWTGLALGLFLVALNGFFVAAEFALVKVRPTQLQPYVERGHRRGRLARHMLHHLDAYLSACQVGITLASLALGWIGEPAFAWIVRPVVELFPGATEAVVHSVSLTAAFLIITFLHIVVGEMAPKSLAIRKAESTSLWIAFPLWAFYKITYPAIWLLNWCAIALLSTVGLSQGGEAGHDEEELRLLLASTHSSHLPHHKRELLDNIFELSHRTARQIMVPRSEVVYLSTERSLEENLALARSSGHTRFPLCEGDLDKAIGLIHIKDIFRRSELPGSLEDVKREITFVPETLHLDRLMRRMRQQRIYMVAALDEFGGVSGIVTLENIVEEIVGEIQDEFDTEEPELVRVAERVYKVDGSMLVGDFETELGLEMSDRDEDTIAGVVLSELGRQPQVGDAVRIGPVEAEVRAVDGNRIRTLRVTVDPGTTVE